MDRLETNHTEVFRSLPYFSSGYLQQPDVESLTRELQCIAVLPLSVSPALVALCRRSLSALSRICAAATLPDISEHVARHFRVSPDDIVGRGKTQRLAFARQVAMFLCRKLTAAPLEAIGEHFHRDHATVHYACKHIRARAERDAAFRLFLAQLEAKIKTVAAGAAA
jgi:chromosomal replication initiator protein